jgi:hypothetical protein
MNHDRLNDYICKLKILSKLEPREKIIIHERTIEIVDYTTYNLARLKKMVKWEDRWHMIVKLEAMYHDIDSIVDNLVNNPPNRTPVQDVLFALDRLRHDLEGSLQGLHNLILTYNTNKSATSRLETLYEDVKILSQKINRFFIEKKTACSSLIDRKNYGVENVYEESKKVKQINAFDPTKPELQVSDSRPIYNGIGTPLPSKGDDDKNGMRTVLRSSGLIKKPETPGVLGLPVQQGLLGPDKLLTTSNPTYIVDNDDDTFSESPIDEEPESKEAIGIASGASLTNTSINTATNTATNYTDAIGSESVTSESSNKAKGKPNRRNRKR